MPEPLLYVVLLGGKHPRASIEVHDVAFAFGDSLEALYPQLRAAWFGAPKGLHVDAWMAVDGVDGWKVRLANLAPGPGEPRLYFINLGGYRPGAFGEDHHYVLVVATNKTDAKALGRARLLNGWTQGHLDALLDVDDCIPLDQVGGRYIHLTQAPHRPIQIRSDYLVIPT
jgi:hypothetical protein